MAAVAAAAGSCSTTTTTTTTPGLHFLLIPLMAQGHMIPMIDLARLLAASGVLVTFITTPVNFARIRPIADRAAASLLPIRFVQLIFPVTEAGLPAGCESIDLVTSSDDFLPFMNSLQLLRHPLLTYLRSTPSDHWPPPSAIISDNIHHWTTDIARSLQIPRIIFHGPSCFYLLCALLIHRNRSDLEAAVTDAESTTIPGLPNPPIRIRKHQIIINPGHSSPGWSEILNAIREAEDVADGVVVNSFADLEPLYLERYREEVKNKPVWPIGPLCLYKEEAEGKAARGRVSTVDSRAVLRWLDEKEDGSVVLVSFGSIARNTAAQLMELGKGLEGSGRAFVWVVKEVEGGAGTKKKLGEWMGEMERRVEGRGMVIRGWAPQAMILGHGATGGFVTHCGWNSVVEAVAAGVVMATWPHFADQFLNERFVVDVAGIGVAVGVEEETVIVGSTEGGGGGDEGEEEVKVRRVVEEGEERRRRVKELAEKARRAMEEGGSSSLALRDAIDYVSKWSGGKDNTTSDVI